MKFMVKKRAFTLIEILLIVAIIGILASIMLVLWGSSARDKAAINAYWTSMDSVRSAVEICTGAGRGTAMPGAPGARICDYNNDGTADGNELYPILNPRCNNISQFIAGGGEGNWIVTTDADCKGCQLTCTVTGCVEVVGTDCN